MTENATATLASTQISPGVFQYTVTLTDTGTTPISTFWFAWDDVPDQDFMSQIPSNVTGPAGWFDIVTTHVYPGGTGYGIEWRAGASLNPGDTTSAFTFTSTETPAQMAAVSPFDNTFQTMSSFVYAGIPFATSGANLVVAPASSGLIDGLNVNQQLELIYIAYFNRSADGGGSSFWVGQNAQAQANGQGAAQSLTNIANSFTPQTETIALYPFLATPNLDLNTQPAQVGLNAFIDSVYGNMFGRAADAAGKAFWVGQVTSGAVGLGAAALAIANGATGTDANELKNKITVALDFTTRTNAAGLGVTSTPASFLAAARNGLAGVDGASLNDASVAIGETATTNFINSSTLSYSVAGDQTIISASGSTIDPGAGSHTIQFLTGVSGDALVLHANGVDTVSGFDPGGDTLDLSSLLSEANVMLNGDTAILGNYVSISDQGNDAVVMLDPTGHGGGSAVAVLQGLGMTVTGIDTVIAKGMTQGM